MLSYSSPCNLFAVPEWRSRSLLAAILAGEMHCRGKNHREHRRWTGAQMARPIELISPGACQRSQIFQRAAPQNIRSCDKYSCTTLHLFQKIKCCVHLLRPPQKTSPMSHRALARVRNTVTAVLDIVMRIYLGRIAAQPNTRKHCQWASNAFRASVTN